ncbi:MAG: type VI secretion system-associated FHA domain protein TagH, partial [Candidatus Thiodiazotropha sp.]
MKLILTVTSEQRTGMGPDSRHVFDGRGGSIGRAPESDWVLPDADCIVSNQHSLIDYRDGDFYLTDTSTNGVFLNDAEKPLGYNGAVRLQEGDSLGIGDYRIRIEVASTGRVSMPAAHAKLSRSVDEAMLEPIRLDSANSEPLPLGLSGESGQRRSSKSSPAGERDRPDAGYTHPDHTPAVNEAFSLPGAYVEQLPEDWDKVVDGAEFMDVEEIPPQPALFSHEGLPPSQTPLVSNSPDSTPKNESRDAAPQASADNNLSGINEFLRGAGIDSAKAQSGNPKLSLEHLGRLYREMVQGVMDVLVARSSLKNEFRMPHTIIRATENNPLKFSMSVDDALEYLLIKEGDGFLPAEEALREAYQDIKDHQLATVVGMRAASNSTLQMFAPEQLQSNFKSGSKRLGMLPR